MTASSDIGKLYWHVHHDKLLEPLTEELQTRIDYIKANKPENEIATRLRLMHLASSAVSEGWTVYDKIWSEGLADFEKARSEAWAVYHKIWSEGLAVFQKAGADAWAVYDKTEFEGLAVFEKAMSKAWAVHEKAMSKAWASVDAIHKQECPNCPWNGETIFP